MPASIVLAILVQLHLVTAPKMRPSFMSLMDGEQPNDDRHRSANWEASAAASAVATAGGVAVAAAAIAALHSVRAADPTGVPLHISQGSNNMPSQASSSRGYFPKSGSKPQATVFIDCEVCEESDND
eukprot:6200585-Pleurochrysis_carterae.AAC.1